MPFRLELASYRSGSGNDRNLLALTIFLFEAHFAVGEGEKGEVAAEANVLTRVEHGAYLANWVGKNCSPR